MPTFDNILEFNTNGTGCETLPSGKKFCPGNDGFIKFRSCVKCYQFSDFCQKSCNFWLKTTEHIPIGVSRRKGLTIDSPIQYREARAQKINRLSTVGAPNTGQSSFGENESNFQGFFETNQIKIIIFCFIC